MISRRRFLGIGILIVGIAILLSLAFVLPARNDVTLPDGSTLVLVIATHKGRHEFYVGNPLRQILDRILFKFLGPKTPGNPPVVLTAKPASDSDLFLVFTRKNTFTPKKRVAFFDAYSTHRCYPDGGLGRELLVQDSVPYGPQMSLPSVHLAGEVFLEDVQKGASLAWKKAVGEAWIWKVHVDEEPTIHLKFFRKGVKFEGSFAGEITIKNPLRKSN